jgi:hypothetical protein
MHLTFNGGVAPLLSGALERDHLFHIAVQTSYLLNTYDFSTLCKFRSVGN